MSAKPDVKGLGGASGRGVRAVLGPTNTGKTHLAIERMAAHHSGLIGLPLRLLAREVYQRLCEKVGAANTALITGEEKIVPPGARYQVCTVEAMPSQTSAAFVAVDEVQLAADLERGHVFTDRILNLRGTEETMLLGASTAEPLLRQLLPGIDVITRPRMSVLEWAGSKKITRLPPRSAIVAFSADEVYAIAELIRRQRGGAAVVLGSLSPRTRNAQVALYQSGDVDFLVATDAIGMGLNLDLDHVAFAQDRKFDGLSHRRLKPSEMGQIAGRAGRHMRNGSFGVTGQVPALEAELVERLETHAFDPEKVFIWRNRDLDFSGIEALSTSLAAPSTSRLLMKGISGTDAIALETLSREEEIAALADDEEGLRLLWDVCLTPDYRRISPGSHAELLRTIFTQLRRHGEIETDWFSRHVDHADRTDGDIDVLSARIAQVRTWTYLSNRPGWLSDTGHWQERTREVEDRLSDALHESLTKRFIDRRTSVLMKRLRENSHMEAQIDDNGAVSVEGHPVGSLSGFRFLPDISGQTPEARAAATAAMKALASEIERRANRLAAAPNTDVILSSDGMLRWIGAPVARLTAGQDVLRPRVTLIADEQLTGTARDQVAARLDRWVTNHIANILKPLVEMTNDQTLDGMARGLAFRLVENLGNMERRQVATDVAALDQNMRSGLRRHGVRFGAYTIFVPALLKPAPAELLCLLWGIHQGRTDAPGLQEVPAILASGRTSARHDPAYENEAWRLCGYRVMGQKAVRIDILERLADLIRPALSWKPDSGNRPPDGAVDGRTFIVTPAMMSILGATHEDMDLILKELGYRGETRPAETVTLPAQVQPAPQDGTAAPSAEAAGAASPQGEPQDATAQADPETPLEEPANTQDTHGDPDQGASAAGATSEAQSGELQAGELQAGELQAGEPQSGEPQAEQTGNGEPASDVATPDVVTPDVASADMTAPDEPATITLWRPAGKGNSARQKSRGKKGGDAQARNDDQARSGSQARSGGRRQGNDQGASQRKAPAKRDDQGRGRDAHTGNRPRKEREPDPDSPFAKLAALKAELGKRTDK